jgi:hypothetical protein
MESPSPFTPEGEGKGKGNPGAIFTGAAWNWGIMPILFALDMP